MKILTRYVLREHVAPLLFSLSALTSLLLLNYIAKNLSQLVGKGLPWTVVAEFLLLSIPFTVAMTLPMAVLVATLYAFGRLAAENEISAMKANGVAMGRLMLPVGVASVLFAVGMVAFNDQVLPRANHRLATLMTDIKKKKPTFALREQVLNDVVTGLSLRAYPIDRATNMLHDVHIYDITVPNKVRTIHADSGSIALTTDQRDLSLRLYSGYIVEADQLNISQLNTTYFSENEIRVRGVGNELQRDSLNLFKGDRERSICEMQQQYMVAQAEMHQSRHEFQQQMIYLTRRAVVGDAAIFPVTDAPPMPQTASWGGLYCDGVSFVSRFTSGGSSGGGAPIGGADVLPPADVSSAAELAAATAAGAGATLDTDSNGLSVATGGAAPPPGGAAVGAGAGGSSGQLDVDMSSGLVVENDLVERPLPLGQGAQGKSAAERVMEGRPAPRTSSLAFGRLFANIDGLGGELDAIRSRMDVSNAMLRSNAVEIHKKFSLAAACVVFVLIGVPFALRFPGGGVGLVIGVSLVVFALSYVGLIAGESLAERGALSPFMAMWAANFLLAAVGIAFLARMGRESTTRGSGFSSLIDDIRDRFSRRRSRESSSDGTNLQ